MNYQTLCESLSYGLDVRPSIYFALRFRASPENKLRKVRMNEKLTWDDFMKVEMRVGTIISAETFKEVRNPAYKMIIDFGEFGKRKTSAQITALYGPRDIIGRQVIAVINFPSKQIANIMSECLVLGGIGENKEVVLIGPERKVENGTRIG